MSNARLADSTRTLAERLRAISELAGRLNRLQDAHGVARAIVAEARRLIDYDTIRVYVVDHEAGMCEPIAFHGSFQGSTDPDLDTLRVPVGTGLTGWVAAHGKTIRLGDAGSDPRAFNLVPSDRPESALLVPMTYEKTVHGVLVVSKDGRDRFDSDDETTFNIFAGYAAHALLNATNMERLHRQQLELEHQLDGQRRLLEVNERLLSTLEPAGVLDLIADSLKAIVPYDSLTIYRIDRAAGVRRAVIARDRFADLILAYEGPLGTGISGWVIDHSEAVLANEAHLDPRSVQVPGTPFEPEAMIVVPLLVNGEAIGTLNIGRMGGPEASFTANEFELTQLFAGQASIALQNAEIHGAVRVRAEHDALTGLRNHGSFQRELGEALFDAVINESVGHSVGDRLLVAVGQRLVACLRPGDTVARFGGDEFGILLDEVANADEARTIAERIGSELRAPFPMGAREWFISASIGISLGLPGRATPEEMLREAEIAMVRAKSDPSMRHALFEPSMSDQTIERIDLENDLRQGIERGELRLHYQPLVDLANGTIVGFEALVRWQHPVRGLVPPVSFIPLAEETGLVLPLGRWVLETACRQARAWRDARPNGPELFMSVNLSARQFMQPDLVDQVAAILSETGLAAGGLEIEITESVLMDQSEAGIRTLGRLRELGVRLVLDDFGTGYSSLSYLKHLPLDTIKIDRTFVAGLAGDTDRSIVEAVVALARGLRIGVVAEGIETEAQYVLLRDIGCDVGQGYLFSRPLPADDAARLITAHESGAGVRAVAPRVIRSRVPKPVRARSAGRPRPALRAS